MEEEGRSCTEMDFLKNLSGEKITCKIYNLSNIVQPTTSFSIFNSCNMKSLWFEFCHDIFTGLKMPNWKTGIPTLRPCHFEASEDIITKFESQALHIIAIKYWKASGSGNPPFLIPAFWKIAIYVLKTKFYVLFCTRLLKTFSVFFIYFFILTSN